MEVDGLIQGFDIHGSDRSSVNFEKRGGVAPELFLDPLRAIGCFAQACAIETRIPKVKLSVGLFAQKMLHGRSGEVCWREDKWCRLKQISKRGASS